MSFIYGGNKKIQIRQKQMIKYICDICQKELTDLTQKGEFIIQSEKLSLNFDSKTHLQQKQIMGRGYLFCVDCAEKLEEHIKDLQKIK